MGPKASIQETIGRAWRWLKNRIAHPVPADIEACEFHCDRPDCRKGDWEQCENRLAHEAWAKQHPSHQHAPRS